MGQQNASYHRRRAAAEAIVAAEGTVPEWAVGIVRLALHEQAITAAMQRVPEEAASVHVEPAVEPPPSAEAVSAAIGRPVALSGDLERATSMADAIGADMVEADARRRWTPNPGAEAA